MTPKQIGAVMRKAREARGWTVNRTATESGLKHDQIKSIEQGAKAYTIPAFLTLCGTLGVKMELHKAE